MLTLIALIAVLQAQPSGLPTERERAAIAEAAASDAASAAGRGVGGRDDLAEGGELADAASAAARAARWAGRQTDAAAVLAGEEWFVAQEVARMLDDREAACRQAEFIQSRLFSLSEKVGDADDDLAMIYMWAGFIRNRSCNAPVGDPEL